MLTVTGIAVEKDKKNIRDTVLYKREHMSENIYNEYSVDICQKIQTVFLTSYKSCMGFIPIRKEVDIRPLLSYAITNGTLVLPKVLGSYIKPIKVCSLSVLEPGYKGVLEPPDGDIAATVELIIVPGVAFSKSGDRVGYGAGFYDRFLSNSDAVCIAPAFSFQIVQQIDTDCFDIPVDYIVTEKTIINCRKYLKRRL